MTYSPEAFLDRLRRATEVIVDPHEIQAAALDGRGRRQGRALAIVRPASTQEVSAVLAAAQAFGAVVIAQGGNTSNVEGATPSPAASEEEALRTIILQTRRMNRILEIDPVDNTATVEAGVVLERLQEAARDAGRLFPLSLAAEGTAEIGGVLATNAGGVHVLRYGMARSLALGLKVVLADGTVLDLMRRLRKDNSGYDLRDLFIGSEGTLGVITEAVLKLEPLPRARLTFFAPLASLSAVEMLFTKLEAAFGPSLTAYELIGRSPLAAVLAEEMHEAPFEPADWQVLADVSLFGDEAEEVRAGDALETLLMDEIESGRLLNAVLARSETQAAALWAIREGIPGAVKRRGGNVKHDVSVPRSKLVGFVVETVKELEARFPGIEPSIFGHYGDGNLHFNVGPKTAFAHEEEIHETVYRAVLAAGGSIAAEHGVGAMKVEALQASKSPSELALMRTLKRTLDPENRLNPGRVVRV